VVVAMRTIFIAMAISLDNVTNVAPCKPFLKVLWIFSEYLSALFAGQGLHLAVSRQIRRFFLVADQFVRLL
jgi:hypothetical protein